MTFLERIDADPFLVNSKQQEEFMDELTGTISRRHILRYIHYLIGNNIPFTMAILDLDNFKLVNDKYGHSVGDQLLKQFGMSIREYIAPVGVVGRFGGDEFLLINLKTHRFDDIKQYFHELYNSEKVVRRNYYIGEIAFDVTATVGTATFSRDSREYDQLFIKADKALYRGKSKGRNCYVIYNEEMHNNIDILDINKLNVPAVMDHISSIFLFNKKIDKSIEESLAILQKELYLNLAFYVDTTGRMITSKARGSIRLDPRTIVQAEQFFGDQKLIEFSNLSKYTGERGPIIMDFLSNKIESVLIKKVYFGEKPFGMIGFLTIGDNRIWQQDDKIMLTYLEKLIGFSRLHRI